MQYKTYGQIRIKVEKDLDLEDELFIQDDEMLDYANEAIDEAEAEIHAIYEDYFLTYSTISLVNGQEEYDLPTDMYANKIRGIVYNNGSTIYNIPELRHSAKFELIELSKEYTTTDFYKYMIINRTAGANPKMLLVPQAREDGTDRLKIWYLRQANRMVDDTTVCDIPEFAQFVIQYMKVRCYEKEGHPNMGMAARALEMQRRLMVDTLSNMIPDADNQVEMDLSHYDDMS